MNTRIRSRALFGFLAVGVLAAACAPSTSVRKEQAISANETKELGSKYTGPKRRIGVVSFENKTAYGQNRLGGAASDILITELVKTGKFIVVERDKMDKIMGEQKLQTTGAIDPNTVVTVGKILGLNALVIGAVSEFGVKNEGSQYLLVQSKRQIAQVTVDLRLVDAETGQVLYADSGKGKAKSSKGSVLGLGTTGGYDETLEGEALRAAIAQFTANILSQVNKKPWSCRIAAVQGDVLYLNAGPTMGIDKGMELDCFHLGKQIMDPTTGLVLGSEETALGRAQVLGPLGEEGQGSTAKLIKSTGVSPEAKDICRLKS